MKKFLTGILLLISTILLSQTVTISDTTFSSKGDTTINIHRFTAGYKTTISIDTATVKIFKPYIPVIVTIPPISIPSTVTFVNDTIPLSDPEVYGPGRGLNDWQGKQAYSYPSSDAYYRFLTSQIQTGPSTYNWNNLDAQVKAAIDKGQKITIGFVTVCTTCLSGDGIINVDGGTASYPAFLHTQMQAESVKDWKHNGNIWTANYNSPSYIAFCRSFLKAVTDHLNTTPYKSFMLAIAVDKFDIRMFGNWGEWQTDGFTDEPAAAHASDASLIAIAQAHIDAFPNNWLLASVSAYDLRYVSNVVSYFMLTAKNNKGNIGFRSDHGGDAGINNFDTLTANRPYTTPNGITVNFKTELKKRWTVAPCTVEPMNSASTTNDFQNLIKDVQYYHLTQISNESVSTDATAQNSFMIASKATGYRYSFSGGTYTTGPGSLALTLNWSNSGNCQTYDDWNVWIEFRTATSTVYSMTSSLKLKSFLPGQQIVLDKFSGIPSGSYSIYVIVKDPSGYRKPLPLANKNRNSDGSYKIADVKL